MLVFAHASAKYNRSIKITELSSAAREAFNHLACRHKLRGGFTNSRSASKSILAEMKGSKGPMNVPKALEVSSIYNSIIIIIVSIIIGFLNTKLPSI